MMDGETIEAQDNTDASEEPQSDGNLLTDTAAPTEDAEEAEDHLDGDDTEDTEGDDDGSGEEGESDDQNEGAPEEYADFDLPEGFEGLDESLLSEAAPLFKENGLSQAEAQKFIDLYSNTLKGQNEAALQAFTEVNNKNKEAIEKHSEYGGDNLKTSLTDTARAIDVVMGERAPEFRDLLNQTGLGNHPLMFELLTKVGKSVNEDGFVEGGKANTTKSMAETMYGKDGTGVKA